MADEAPPRVTAIHLPKPGDQLTHNGRKYFLGDEIGQGYFGKVFGCSDRWANELVAKILLPRGRTYEQVEAEWKRELSNLLTLRHPHITYAYDAFEYNQTFFLVLERCGSDLHELIKLDKLQPEKWLPSLARDVLQGLEFIHHAGFVHKDLHPGNIFVAWHRDRVLPHKEPVVSFKIGDLGITRLESDINVFNTMLAQWMLPPEALDPGSFGEIGRTVDIYHIGLVFLSLLLGQVPNFDRVQVLAGEPRRLAEQLKSPYAAPVARALRRHTRERYQSAAEFWQALLAAMPEDARPV
jgi:serine/threonine protein kinase